MGLTKEQEELYKKTMDEAKKQLESIDSDMAEEIQKIREKLAQLQESKKSFRQLYEASAQLLGIEVEPESENEDDITNGPQPAPTN